MTLICRFKAPVSDASLTRWTRSTRHNVAYLSVPRISSQCFNRHKVVYLSFPFPGPTSPITQSTLHNRLSFPSFRFSMLNPAQWCLSFISRHHVLVYPLSPWTRHNVAYLVFCSSAQCLTRHNDAYLSFQNTHLWCILDTLNPAPCWLSFIYQCPLPNASAGTKMLIFHFTHLLHQICTIVSHSPVSVSQCLTRHNSAYLSFRGTLFWCIRCHNEPGTMSSSVILLIFPMLNLTWWRLSVVSRHPSLMHPRHV